MDHTLIGLVLVLWGHFVGPTPTTDPDWGVVTTLLDLTATETVSTALSSLALGRGRTLLASSNSVPSKSSYTFYGEQIPTG